MIKAGRYKGKINNYGLKKSKNGDPSPTIVFDVTLPDGGTERVFWQGYFANEKSSEITLETLIVCGLESVDDLPMIVQGYESGILDMEKEFEVRVEVERNDEGKEFARVRGVYDTGPSAIRDQIDQEEAHTLFASRNLNGLFAKIAAGRPARQESSAIPPQVGY